MSGWDETKHNTVFLFVVATVTTLLYTFGQTSDTQTDCIYVYTREQTRTATFLNAVTFYDILWLE